MVKAFNLTFGHDERDIETWGRMCVLVGMEDIPEGLEARKLVYIKFLVGVMLNYTFELSLFEDFSSRSGFLCTGSKLIQYRL